MRRFTIGGVLVQWGNRDPESPKCLIGGRREGKLEERVIECHGTHRQTVTFSKLVMRGSFLRIPVTFRAFIRTTSCERPCSETDAMTNPRKRALIWAPAVTAALVTFFALSGAPLMGQRGGGGRVVRPAPGSPRTTPPSSSAGFRTAQRAREAARNREAARERRGLNERPPPPPAPAPAPAPVPPAGGPVAPRPGKVKAKPDDGEFLRRVRRGSVEATAFRALVDGRWERLKSSSHQADLMLLKGKGKVTRMRVHMAMIKTPEGVRHTRLTAVDRTRPFGKTLWDLQVLQRKGGVAEGYRKLDDGTWEKMSGDPRLMVLEEGHPALLADLLEPQLAGSDVMPEWEGIRDGRAAMKARYAQKLPGYKIPTFYLERYSGVLMNIRATRDGEEFRISYSKPKVVDGIRTPLRWHLRFQESGDSLIVQARNATANRKMVASLFSLTKEESK